MNKQILIIILLIFMTVSQTSCNRTGVKSSDISSAIIDYDYYDYNQGSEIAESTDSVTSETVQSNISSKLTSSLQQTYDSNTYNVNTDWFMNAKYGIFIHYLEQLQNNKSDLNGLSQGKQTSWDECVNEFNVETFAKNAKDTGAGYVIFSIMQASKYMDAPNAAYNKYTGYKTGEACSSRDLIADLITALNKYDIKLMLYFTGDGPRTDSQASKGLNMDINAGAEFRAKWFEVAREYSLRYGSKIYGWWIDGAHLSGYNDTTLAEFASALKAGNPKSIVAFNPGGANNDVKFFSLSDDYTAGERNDFTGQIPNNRFVNPELQKNRKQWHVLSYLGSNWAATDTKYTTRNLISYVKKCNLNGGVVTIDVGLYRDGSISSRQMDFLKEMKSQIR